MDALCAFENQIKNIKKSSLQFINLKKYSFILISGHISTATILQQLYIAALLSATNI